MRLISFSVHCGNIEPEQHYFAVIPSPVDKKLCGMHPWILQIVPKRHQAVGKTDVLHQNVSMFQGNIHPREVPERFNAAGNQKLRQRQGSGLWHTENRNINRIPGQL